MSREEEILRKKAEAFDHYVLFEKLKAEIIQLENEKVEENVSEVELPQVEASVEENVESAVVTPIEQPVQETAEVELPQAETPVEENVESAVVTPLIQPEVENVNEVVPSTQPLDQTPLAPIGVELPNVEEKPIDKEVYVKTDVNEARAILINAAQSEKLRNSKAANKVTVFGQETVEVPVESKEDINKQLEAMMEQLRTTTDEEKANELNSQISALTKKLGEAA